MNSGLQCLANCEGLVEYFLTKRYTKEINLESWYGTKGKLVKQFADFLFRFWNGEEGMIRPWGMKKAIGQFNEAVNTFPTFFHRLFQFASKSQQDTHEFLNFLLDGLHEDLNRIKRKRLTLPILRVNLSDRKLAAIS